MARDEETRDGVSAEEAEETAFETGQDKPQGDAFEYDETALNLVPDFKAHPEGVAELKAIASKVLNDFDEAWRSTEMHRKRQADIWNYFSGVLPQRSAEYAHMSQAHVPILMENITRMHARQAYELFGNWTNVFGVTPIGPDDEQTARLLSLHGNWQIRTRIKDFKRQMHRALLLFDLFGDLTVRSYYDTDRKCNRHDVLTGNEFVCGGAHVSTMPDYSDVPFIAYILRLPAHDLRKKEEFWSNVPDVLKRIPAAEGDPELSSSLKQAVDRNLGVDRSEFTRGDYELIQYEGWLNLPNQDRDRYCQVIVDKVTQHVLSLQIYERVDPFDQRRYEFELQQLEAYQQSVQEAQLFEQERQQTLMAAMAMGNAADPNSDEPAMAVMRAREIEAMPAPEPLPMPPWMNGDPNAVPAEPLFEPIRLGTHFVNIEPLQGVLGMGPGSMLCDQNKAANIALQQFIDQGTFGNMRNYLARGGLKMPDKLVLAPGKVHSVPGAHDLSKDILPIEFGPANPQLLNLVTMMSEFGNRITNTPEVLSGEAGKSGETAQGISARIEQATKMLSVPTGRFADDLKQVLINNAKLNAIFLPDVEFFSINNHDPSLGALGRRGFEVGRDMYDRPYDVEISADLKFTSTAQRISEADALVQLPNAVMPLQANFAFQYETIKKSLEARSRNDLVGLMGPPPPPPVAFGAPTSPPAPPPGAPPVSPGPGGQGPNPQPQQGAPQ